MNIKVKYGIDNCDRSFAEENVTIGQIIGDGVVRAHLGYGDNVRALINGVEQPMHAIVPDGATITLETRANSKAVTLMVTPGSLCFA